MTDQMCVPRSRTASVVSARDEVEIGLTADGDPLCVSREYRGDKSIAERERWLAGAVRNVRDVVTYTRDICTCADCPPGYHDPLTNLRSEFVTLMCQSLNSGLYPRGLPHAVRKVAAETDISSDDVENLISEIDAYLASYCAQVEQPQAEQPRPERMTSGVLSDAFWSARPAFGQIRDAARSRLIAPDGVFAALLMRLAAMTDFRIVLPGIVGRYGSLNSAAVLVAPSGGGKGSALDTARDLLPEPLASARFKDAPIGSGEGMVRGFFEQTKQTGEDGKSHVAWEQRYDAIGFRIDEGEMLKSLAERSGQTTMTLIRSAWSGEQLGNAYADRDRRGFILPAHSYRASLIMAVQPEHAAFLIDDAAGGTPQRFLWSALVDPTAPALDDLAPWPGALTWQPPDWRDGERISIGGFERSTMSVAPSIVASIRKRRYDVTTGKARPDPLDAHADLVQLKVAGLLAILDERLDLTEDDWQLAAIVCETSRRVRAWVRAELRQVAEKAESGAIQRSTRRAIAVEAAKANTPRDVERVAAVIAAAVARAGPTGITSGKLRAAVAGRDRDLFGPALDDATAKGLVRERDGRLVSKVVQNE